MIFVKNVFLSVPRHYLIRKVNEIDISIKKKKKHPLRWRNTIQGGINLRQRGTTEITIYLRA